MTPLKLKTWYHVTQTDKSFPEANAYPVSGMLAVYDYDGEEIYTLPDHPFLQRLSKGIGTPFFFYDGLNTVVHYFKAPSRDILLISLRIQGAKVKSYMEFQD